MQRPAMDFGPAGVVRFYCDADGCSRPLGIRPDGTVGFAYRGRAGDYCSRACLLRCDARREKVNIEAEVKPLQETQKVKPAAVVRKKVKIIPPENQVEPTPDASSLSHWKWQRNERRAAVHSIRKELLKNQEGREPTIATVRERLLQIGFKASVRSVWQDLRFCQGLAPCPPRKAGS